MTKYIIHETYEYTVDAETPEQAAELWHDFMEHGETVDGVEFTQNYANTYNEEGREV